MMYVFRQSVWAAGRRRGFTLVEMVAALAILVGILSAVLVVMNRAVEATVNLRSRQRAFEVARENLETLMTSDSVSDLTDYGYSEQYPEIYWEIRIEPFYEPISNKMWIRAVSIASFENNAEEDQSVELEQWLVGLNAQQIKQILDQKKTEEKILEELYGDQDSQMQEIIKLYLKEAGLDGSAYEAFLRRQRNEKLAYLIDNGFDDGYETLLEAMEADEAEFLYKLGADFDELEEFTERVKANPQLMAALGGSDGPADALPDEPDPDDPRPKEEPEPEQPDLCADINCAEIPQAFRPLFCQLLRCCCE